MGNVLKISDAASLGLHAMAIMAKKPNDLVSVKEISESIDVSANHLSKVMQRLVKADLVISIKGFRGGFQLAKRPEEITFLDIYEAIDGRFKPSGCLLNKANCQHQCIMGDFLQSINTQVEDFFSTKRLIDFTQHAQNTPEKLDLRNFRE